MKDGIHPTYREVCFQDLSNGFKFVTRSCLQSRETIKMEDGRELPLMKLESTSETHPFYTGTQKSIDNLGGRVREVPQQVRARGPEKAGCNRCRTGCDGNRCRLKAGAAADHGAQRAIRPSRGDEAGRGYRQQNQQGSYGCLFSAR